MSKHILKAKTVQTEKITAQDLDRVKSDKILQYDPLPILDEDGDLVHKKWLDDALLALGGGGSARLISSELIIASSTAGTISALWVDFTSETESVTDEPLSFNGGGLPSAGTFRFDLVQGLDDGTVEVKEGVEGDGSVGTQPSPDAGKVALAMVLWNELGEGEVIPPELDSDWSIKRFNTGTAPNTTGKYAKVWEGDLSAAGNYSIYLAYAEPKNAVNFDGSGLQTLKVSFTCSEILAIITDTVQIVTAGGSIAGEFILYELAGNKAALYHKSNHYWGRIQYRVLFQNSQVNLDDFFTGQAYGAAPAFEASWESSIEAGGGEPGPVGPPGPQGEPGEQGPPGEDGEDAAAINFICDEFSWTTGAKEFTPTETPTHRPILILNTTVLKNAHWTWVGGVATITEDIASPSVVLLLYWTALSGITIGAEQWEFNGHNFFASESAEEGFIGKINKRGGLVPVTSGGGIVFTFRQDASYGTPDAPLSGALSEDFPDSPDQPLIGTRIILFHEDSVSPFGGGIYIAELDSSTTYSTTLTNVIQLTYLSNTRILYKIIDQF